MRAYLLPLPIFSQVPSYPATPAGAGRGGINAGRDGDESGRGVGRSDVSGSRSGDGSGRGVGRSDVSGSRSGSGVGRSGDVSGRGAGGKAHLVQL